MPHPLSGSRQQLVRPRVHPHQFLLVGGPHGALADRHLIGPFAADPYLLLDLAFLEIHAERDALNPQRVRAEGDLPR